MSVDVMREWTIVGMLSVVFLFFGLSGIGQQALVDEPLWAFDRVEQYWHNLKEFDLGNVRPSDKPGVTTAILGGYGLTVHVRPHEIKDTISPVMREELLMRMRIPIVIAVAFLLPLLYVLTRKIFGVPVAIGTLIMSALSPILIGMSRILNPDALLWILLPLTILAFASTLHTASRKLLVLSGVLLGLSLLTKYVATILLAFFPLMIALHAFYVGMSRETVRKHLQMGFRSFGISSVIALGVYCLLLPSIWVRPEHILTGTILSQAFAPVWKPYLCIMILIVLDLYLFRRSFVALLVSTLQRVRQWLLPSVAVLWILVTLLVIVTAHIGGFDYQTSLQSPKSSGRDLGFLTTFLADFYVLIFALSPIVLGAFLAACVSLIRERLQAQHFVIVSLLLFPPVYYLGSALSGVSTILRYQVAVFPIIFIVAAYGVWKILGVFPRTKQIIAAGICGLLLLISLYGVAPYYFSYTSPLLPEEQILNIKDMGDGSYQAAAYLNVLPDAESLTIWADKAGVCDSFVGTCDTTVTASTIAKAGYEFDYYVISRGRKHLTERHAPRHRRKEDAPGATYHFERLYAEGTPHVHEILPGSHAANYIRIIDAQTVEIFDANDEQ